MRRVETAMDRYLGFGAVACALSGALRIVAAFIPYDPAAAWLEALYAACDLGMMFGLFAVYIAAAERVGIAGLVTFVIALAALASIVGPDASAFGVDFYRAGATVFALALAAFAATLLGARLFAASGVLWIMCAAFGVVASATGDALAFVGAGLALGAGFIAAGMTLFRSPRLRKTAAA
jgi:hypothetical protein